MPAPITIADFVTDPALLGNSFAGDSWAAAKVILRAMHGLPIHGASREMFRALAGDREPPKEPVKEAVIVAGRRFGKDSTASADATFSAAIVDHRPHLRVGERATVLCLAVDKIQATRFLRYIRGYFKASPLLKARVTGETTEGLLLDGRHVEIIVTSSNFRQAGRGITAAYITLNEAAFLMDAGSSNPASEIYRSLLPSLSTLPTSKLLTVSSPYTQSGLLFDLVSRHYGKNSDVLVFKGASRLGNPTLDEARIARALSEDYESAKAEYLGLWRSSTAGFLPREMIEAAIDRDVTVRPRIEGVTYFAFTDPSGGQHDSFTLAIAHLDGDQVVLDLLYERVPKFVTTAVVAEIAALLRSYGLNTVTGDRYAAEWVRGAFAAVGIEYTQSRRDKSAIYANVMPLFTAGRLQLLDVPKMTNQFAALERIVASGKEKVDHPRGQFDDVANAVAGALVLAAERDTTADEICPVYVADAPTYDRWRPDYSGAVAMPMGGYGGGGSAAPDDLGFVGWTGKGGNNW
jgi:hypothetical protein